MSASDERPPGEQAFIEAHIGVERIEYVLKVFEGFSRENYELEPADVTYMIDVIADCVKDVDKHISKAEDAQGKPGQVVELDS